VPDATVTVEPLRVGEIHFPPGFFERTGGRLELFRSTGIGTSRSRWPAVPCPVYLVHHPGAGSFVVDTGLHPSVASKPAANMGRLVGALFHPRLAAGEDLPAQLRERGLDAAEIPLVVMTHLHFDHASGMSAFPNSTFVVSATEWEAATTDRRPLFRGYRPAHFDYAFEYRTVDYDAQGITSYSTFGRTFDLFGDGSVRLAYTPGHSAGHQSVIAKLRERDVVIAGDAIYTLRQLEGGPEPPFPADRHMWRRSLQELRLFHRQYPQAPILPGHDPEHWPTVQARYD
jgi:glyoxylase-like metal-dependent hydrolase (beta-lactamase superfamily II)